MLYFSVSVKVTRNQPKDNTKQTGENQVGSVAPAYTKVREKNTDDSKSILVTVTQIP